jgi:integrase
VDHELLGGSPMSVNVRILANGKKAYDVRMRDPQGRQYKKTFRTRKEAEAFESTQQADRARGGWVDPRKGKVSLREYSTSWIALRHDLRPRTRELYEALLRLHILPTLGGYELAEITTGLIRKWHAEIVASGKASTAARTYRLLRTILGAAVEDEVIGRNPCVLKGAGVERPDERPIATVAQVEALAGAVDERFRCLVLLGTYASLRLGELAALRRRHLDLLHGRINVVEQAQDLRDGTRIVGPPKTEAGRRVVGIPPHVLPAVEAHLDRFVPADPDALLFTGAKGAPIRRTHWNRKWRAATHQVGLPGFHFHDLRHTGNTLAAATGASTKELMARMGHASSRAALIYQHATQERDDGIAAAISELVSAPADRPVVLRRRASGDSGAP